MARRASRHVLDVGGGSLRTIRPKDVEGFLTSYWTGYVGFFRRLLGKRGKWVLAALGLPVIMFLLVFVVVAVVIISGAFRVEKQGREFEQRFDESWERVNLR